MTTRTGNGKGTPACKASTKTAGIVLCLLLANISADCYGREKGKITLLRLTEFWQSAGATYHFGEFRSETDEGLQKTTEHNIDETYRAGTRYSLLNPRILRGGADLGISLQQDSHRSSSSGSGNGDDLKLTYNVNGIILDRTWAPITFASGSSYQRIKKPFSASYYMQTDSHNVDLNFRNSLLPATLSYGLTEYDTTGLNQDRNQVSETVSASVSHLWKISTTSARVYNTETTTEFNDSAKAVHGKLFHLNAANSLAWKHGPLVRQIDTHYSYDRNIDDFKTTAGGLSEHIRLDLGKALETRIRYINTNRKSNGLDYQENSGSLSLLHHLYKSLTTSMTGTASSLEFTDGRETSHGGSLGIAYEKVLPADSHLSVGYSFLYAITDRDRLNYEQQVINERYTVPTIEPLEILLPVPHIRPETLVVKDASNPAVEFLAERDYHVESFGSLTRLVIIEGSIILDSAEVLVSYTFVDNPRLSYSTQAHNASLRLSLLQQNHLIFARTALSDQDILQGDEEFATVASSSYYELGYERHLNDMTVGAEYIRERSAYIDSNDLQGYWRYGFNSGRASVFFNISDRYSWYGNAGSGDDHRNVFRASTRYRRMIVNNTQLSTTLDFSDKRSDSGSSEKISFLVDLRSRFGSTVASISSSSDWLFGEKNDSYIQNVMITLYRVF